MSNYRMCKLKIGQREVIKHTNFDNKEDAEHCAKNESCNDAQHLYEVQKNNHGDFITIKSYQNGQSTL